MVHVVVFGATGLLGSEITKALAAQGHSTTAVVRDATPNDANKTARLGEFERAGITVIQHDGSRDGLVDLLKNFTHVVNAVGGDMTGGDMKEQQGRLLSAAKEAGTIKRFLPSEYGYEYGSIRTFAAGVNALFQGKMDVRKQLAGTGMEYTFIVAWHFSEVWLPGLGIVGAKHSREEATIVGSGDVKVWFASLADIAAITARAIDDPKAANKVVEICGSFATQNELVAQWEAVSGTHVKITTISGEDLAQHSAEALAEGDLVSALLDDLNYMSYVDGVCNLDVDPTVVKASDLYPDFKYQTTQEFLAKLAERRSAAAHLMQIAHT